MSCFGEGRVKELDYRVNFTTCPIEVSDHEMVYQTQVCFYAYLFTFSFTNFRNSATFLQTNGEAKCVLTIKEL